MTQSNAALKAKNDLSAYEIGDSDVRSWGHYEVTNIGVINGEEFCEKSITVNPQQALSLQKHQYRREVWEVEQGTLVVMLNDEVINLNPGESVSIPQGAPHTMINLSHKPVKLKEMQMGICREDDNDRLCDYSDRPTIEIDPDDAITHESIKIYKSLIALID